MLGDSASTVVGNLMNFGLAGFVALLFGRWFLRLNRLTVRPVAFWVPGLVAVIVILVGGEGAYYAVARVFSVTGGPNLWDLTIITGGIRLAYGLVLIASLYVYWRIVPDNKARAGERALQILIAYAVLFVVMTSVVR